MNITLEQKNQRKSGAVTIVAHVLILLVVFLVKCWEEPNPPIDLDQGISLEVAFGTETSDVGETEDPFDAAPKASSVPQPQESAQEQQQVEEIEEPLASDDLVEPTEPSEEVQEVVDTPIEPVTELLEPTEPVDDVKPVEPTEPAEDPNESENESQGLEGLDPLDFSGGSSNEVGPKGVETGTSKVGIGIGDATVPKGWGITTEPTPDVKESGEVTISVEFNKFGKVIPSSIKCVGGDRNLFNKNLDIIVKSLVEELQLTQTDTSFEPAPQNKATFRFEFKGH